MKASSILMCGLAISALSAVGTYKAIDKIQKPKVSED